MTKVICCGIKYYNSNTEALNDSDRKITNIIYENSDRINKANEYLEKLKIWQELNLNARTAHWIGDFTKIKQNNYEYFYPTPDNFLSIHPNTPEQVIKFNLFNFHTAVDEIGDFKSFKANYLYFLNEHQGNPLVRLKIRKDLHNLKNQVPSKNFLKGGLEKWFESFRDIQDTLRESDYRIFKDEPIIEYSKKGMFQGEPPYLRYLLDEPKYVFEAANGYLFAQKIPFLQELTELYELTPVDKRVADEVLAETTTQSVQSEENTGKKSKKKGSQLTTKQQLILLDKLGFPSILNKQTTQHQAAILAQLLYRNEQEIRTMLTYWGNVNAPKDYNCTFSDDLAKVIDLLDDNNLLI